MPPKAVMKPYIPELSEQRMIRRAPDGAIDFGPDRDYIFDCLKDVEIGGSCLGRGAKRGQKWARFSASFPLD